MKNDLNSAYKSIRDKRIKALNTEILISGVLLYIALCFIAIVLLSLSSMNKPILMTILFLVNMGYITYILLFIVPKIVRKIEIRAMWLGINDETSDNDDL